MDNSSLVERCLEKIKFGEDLLVTLRKFQHIEGLPKLSRKVKQELNFLQKIFRDSNVKKEHLQCSNFTHLHAVVNTLSESENIETVCKVFTFNDRKITVDIVCNGGLSWVKVVARNPKSLSQISMGDSSFGVRSILDQAEDFIECSQFYPCLFQTPMITFVFSNGISITLAKKLESMNIVVKGNRINDLYLDENNSILEEDLSTKAVSKIDKVNLDVSAMLAYCSSVTNGSCNKYKFDVPLLAQQALWESERPVKPILEAFFKDKTLYCCETARNSFMEIVDIVGGPGEKQRAEEFLSRITVLPDNATAADLHSSSNNFEVFNNVQFTSDKSLEVGGKIKNRALIIFTFGDRIQAVTVTANDGFVRAAKQQGINFVVFVHESRALTEQKEQNATKLQY